MFGNLLVFICTLSTVLDRWDMVLLISTLSTVLDRCDCHLFPQGYNVGRTWANTRKHFPLLIFRVSLWNFFLIY